MLAAAAMASSRAGATTRTKAVPMKRPTIISTMLAAKK